MQKFELIYINNIKKEIKKKESNNIHNLFKNIINNIIENRYKNDYSSVKKISGKLWKLYHKRCVNINNETDIKKMEIIEMDENKIICDIVINKNIFYFRIVYDNLDFKIKRIL